MLNNLGRMNSMARFSDVELGLGPETADVRMPQTMTADQQVQGSGETRGQVRSRILQSELLENPSDVNLQREIAQDKSTPQAKGHRFSDADLGLPTSDVARRGQKVEQIKTLIGDLPSDAKLGLKKQFQPSKKTGGDVLGDVGALVDMFESIGVMAYDAYAYGTRKGINLGTGMGNQEAATLARKQTEELIPDAVVNPFGRVMDALGLGQEYNNSNVTKAMQFIGKAIVEGTGWASGQTGGLVPVEDLDFLTKLGMTWMGAKGGDVAFKRALVKKVEVEDKFRADQAKLEQNRTDYSNPGQASTVTSAAGSGPVADPAVSQANAWLTPVDLERAKGPSQFGTPVPKSPKNIVGTAFRNKESGLVMNTGQAHPDSLKANEKYEAGFVDGSGKFHPRVEAAERAKTQGQIPQDHTTLPDGLHSQDLWPKIGGIGGAAMGAAAVAGLVMALNSENKELPGGLIPLTFIPLAKGDARVLRAEKLRDAGVTRDEVWTMLGVLEGKDKVWRREVSDKDAGLMPHLSTGRDAFGKSIVFPAPADQPPVTLKDVFRHPDLYNLRPGIGHLSVAQLPEGGSRTGSLDYPGGRILLSPGTREALKGTIVHEGMHYVQEESGLMNRGGSKNEFLSKANKDFIKDARGTFKSVKTSVENDIGTVDELAVDRAMEALRDNRRPLPFDQQQLEMISRHPRFQEFLSVLKDKVQADRMETAAYEKYRRLGGEVEARAVTSRMNMSDADRRAVPPWKHYNIPEHDWILKFGVAGAAVGTGLWFANSEEDAKALGWGSLAIARAIKTKGGMWHPNVAKDLSREIFPVVLPHEEFRRLYSHLDVNDPNTLGNKRANELNQWALQATKKYLNKWAATVEDPIRDVQIPYEGGLKSWGQAMQDSIGAKPAWLASEQRGHPLDAYPRGYEDWVRNIPASEPIFNFSNQTMSEGVTDPRSATYAFGGFPAFQVTGAAGFSSHLSQRAIKDYLNHAGEYAQTNIRPEDLKHYDLPRLIQETYNADVKARKAMGQAALETTKHLPVYRDYGDGVKWIALEIPKALNKEQAKLVKPVEDFPKLATDEKWDPSNKFVGLDASGKPVRSTWGGVAGGRTPEEAWISSVLGQESNTMGHSIGGYGQRMRPYGQGGMEALISGKTKNYSLRDAQGLSHATIEVTPQNPRDIMIQLSLTQRMQFAHHFQRAGGRLAPDGWPDEGNIEQINIALSKLNPPSNIDTTLQDINQIKGKQNQAVAEPFLQYGQDFVKKGQWGEVRDLQNVGLVDFDASVRQGAYRNDSAFINLVENKLGKSRFQTAADLDRLWNEYLNSSGRGPGGNQGGFVNLGLGVDAVQWAKDNPRLAAALAGGLAVAGVAEAIDPNTTVGNALGLTALGAAAGFGLSHFPAWWESVRAPSKNATFSESLADSLYKLTKQSQANQIGMLQEIMKVPKTYAQHAELIYHSLEDSTIQLSPEAQALKAKYVDPLMKQNEIIRQAIKNEGVAVGADVDSYVHRIVKGKPSIFEELEQQVSQGRSLSPFASALQERRVFSLTEPSFGTKVYMVMDSKGSAYKVYQGNNVVASGKATAEQLKMGEIPFGGVNWKKGPATTREIEANTPIRYHHDGLASAVGSNVRLTQVYNNVKFLKDLKKDPEFKKVATNNPDLALDDWREVGGLDQFRGWKFEPRTANVLEDYMGGRSSVLQENWGKASRLMTASLFWNPFPHIFNVLDHSIVQRGLVSGWANPAAYPRLARTTLEAWKAVSEQDGTYAKFVKEGAGLMYPNVLVKDFSAKVLKQLGTDPQMGAVATAWGYVNPKAMVQAIYRQSRDTLWKWNDIIMLQAYLEKEAVKGGGKSVIKDIEKHIPNYRIPDQVMGSRMISEFMQSPIALAFGRYDYGRMKSYGEMIKSLVNKDSTIGDKAKALDQIAMVGFMGLVVYPLLMDNAAKALTGNDNATVQRFGAGTVPYLVYEYLHADKRFVDVVNSMYPTGMLLNAALQFRANREFFTGRTLIEDPSDLAQFIANQFNPLYSAGRIIEGKTTPGQFLLQSIGIKSPTGEQVEKRQAFMQREQTKAEKRRERHQ